MISHLIITIIAFFLQPKGAYAEEVKEEEDAIVDDDVVVDETAEFETETKSRDAKTLMLFTRPSHVPGTQLSLPAGYPVEFLVGFLNLGLDEFVVESVEASFRYPMDFNYFIQNFSAIAYNREVKSNHEATVAYSFLPSEAFAGRPFGLNIALNYRDSNGARFTESVFNETISIVEVDEGLDGETFFLYVFLAAIAVLLLVLGQQFLAGSVGKRKRAQVARKAIETGTGNTNDVDYEWLPQEHLKLIRKCLLNVNFSPSQCQFLAFSCCCIFVGESVVVMLNIFFLLLLQNNHQNRRNHQKHRQTDRRRPSRAQNRIHRVHDSANKSFNLKSS